MSLENLRVYFEDKICLTDFDENFSIVKKALDFTDSYKDENGNIILKDFIYNIYDCKADSIDIHHIYLKNEYYQMMKEKEEWKNKLEKKKKDFIKANDKIYLNVDYSKKDVIKNCGGYFDSSHKKWYVKNTNKKIDEIVNKFSIDYDIVSSNEIDDVFDF